MDTKDKIIVALSLVVVLAVGLVIGISYKSSSASGNAVATPRALAPNDDMSSHHSGGSGAMGGSMDDCPASHHQGGASGGMGGGDMSDHHGGSAAASTDPANTGLTGISFSGAVGQQAPDFTLTNQDGGTTKLSDYRGKTVILFFNEGAMCYPACWNQIAAFNNDARFQGEDVVVLNIETDSKAQWDQILGAQPKMRGATILFDTNRAVSKAYDVLNLQSSMHKGDLPGHTYFVIDPQGKITYTLDDQNMAVNNNLLAGKLGV